MFHKLRNLTLTLVAVFAMSVIAAAAAQAEFPAQLTAEPGTTSIHTEQEGNVILTRGPRTVKCNVVTSTGPATNGATEVTLTPVYAGCEAPGLGPATVTTNGCQYQVTFTADIVSGKHTWTGIVHLVCPGVTKQIEIHVYTSAANHTANSPVCTYDFTSAANQNLKTIDFTQEAPVLPNTPKNWILAHLNVAGITSNSTIGSVLTCGPVNDATGTLKGTEKIKGKSVCGEITGIVPSTK